MQFELFNDIVTKAGKQLTWVVAGTYPVVRFFNSKKVLVDTGINGIRQLTVISLSKGVVTKSAKS